MPLVTVVWGLILFKEKLSYAQWTAVLLATIAVLILTVGLTKAPWIALILAFSFSYYAVLKKKLQIAPMVSVTGEVFILIPAAIVIIIYFSTRAGWIIWKGPLHVAFIGLIRPTHGRSAHFIYLWGASCRAVNGRHFAVSQPKSTIFLCGFFVFRTLNNLAHGELSYDLDSTRNLQLGQE